MTITTTNIEHKFSDKLGVLADKHKRSKTKEIHYLIDKEYYSEISEEEHQK